MVRTIQRALAVLSMWEGSEAAPIIEIHVPFRHALVAPHV